jgi:hypothetical protein
MRVGGDDRCLFRVGIEQETNSISGYGQGASGGAKRYAAKCANGHSSDQGTEPFPIRPSVRIRFTSILGAVLRSSRGLHAGLVQCFSREATADSLSAITRFFGGVSSAVLFDLYYPRANRGVSLVFSNAAIGLAARIGGGVLREFANARRQIYRPRKIQ